MSRHIHQASDKLFKLSMAKLPVAIDFFKANLPKELLAKTDLKSLKLEKQSFIDAAYKATEADVVYSVTYRQSTRLPLSAL